MSTKKEATKGFMGEEGGTTTRTVRAKVTEPIIKILNKRMGVAAVKFSEEEPWAITIGMNIALPEKYETLAKARWAVFKKRRELKEIRFMIIMTGIAERVYSEKKRK